MRYSCTCFKDNPGVLLRNLMMPTATSQAPDKKGKKAAATPAAQAEQYHSKQYALVQHVWDGLPYCHVNLMPMKDSWTNGGSKPHTELQAEVVKYFTRESRSVKVSPVEG